MARATSQSIAPGNDPEAALSPAMRQYRAAKELYPDALLFFRMGDFYELFYDDAVVAARELQLTLTARDKLRAIPMCGVPYHAAEVYLQRLLRRGFRVALCEQMEDPRFAKGVVRREVTRVLTPGTAPDPGLASEQSHWLAALHVSGAGDHQCAALARVDLSTGELWATEFTGMHALAQLSDELERLQPAEVLFPSSFSGAASSGSARATSLPFVDDGSGGAAARGSLAGLQQVKTKTVLEDWVFGADYALPLLRRQLGLHSLEGMGLTGHGTAGLAAGALIEYLRRTKQGALEHLDTLRYYERSTALELDAVSVRNLELIEPVFAGETSDATLFATMDACLTPMGKRLLRATLLRPGIDPEQINQRLDAVAELVKALRIREQIRRVLAGVLDLERLLGRVSLDSAGARDLVGLACTLAKLPDLLAAFAELCSVQWRALQADFDCIADLAGDIQATLVEQPPLTMADGGAVRDGVLAELDELRSLSRDSRVAVAGIEERERTRTGIGSLKVRFNSVFGYYLEITKANLNAVPGEYERKQTLVNAERYTTPELKVLEEKILHAQERAVEIERELLQQLRGRVLAAAARVRATARRVAEVDLIACFAHLAVLRGWTRPVVDGSSVLEFAGGRHPVVERRMEARGEGRMVPNALAVQGREAEDANGAPQFVLVTGPNMGGKSTYLRTAALLVILAQCGSFVPAEQMRLGVVDRIYTRIGASDNVARGRSTFMVEMTETAVILNTASPRSLVLLDEMGRGTATYDGLSLAWATVEHLHNTTGSRALFATHYQELTLLEDRLPRLRNVCVKAKETPTGIVFLHQVEAGAASKSYGIEVARLAGVPPAVIDRAREVLRLHERVEDVQVRDAVAAGDGAPAAPIQMTMFTPLSQRIVDRIAATDIDGLTPREALSLLAQLQAELRS